jgi:hypothetical protein
VDKRVHIIGCKSKLLNNGMLCVLLMLVKQMKQEWLIGSKHVGDSILITVILTSILDLSILIYCYGAFD